MELEKRGWNPSQQQSLRWSNERPRTECHCASRKGEHNNAHFYAGWGEKKKKVFAIKAKCIGIWHLLISGWFYMALAKQPLTGKRNRSCMCQDAEVYPKKTLEALQGVIPVQRTLWRQCGPGQHAAKQKGDIISKHSTSEITTNTTQSYRTS